MSFAQARSATSRPPKRPLVQDDEDDADEPASDTENSIDDGDDDPENAGSSGESEDSDGQDADADAPRTVLWQDDDDTAIIGGGLRKTHSASMGSLQDDLSNLPLGALIKAKRKVVEAEVDSEHDSDGSGSESSGSEPEEDGRQGVHEGPSKRRELEKRQNKHAPMAMSSKRPVTRKRTVVEDRHVKPRDPRFVQASGALSEERFHQNYTFLSDLRKSELGALKADRTRARKLAANAPRAVRPEREAEVSRLDYTVKRMESMVNRDRRVQIEHAALEKTTKEEKEKQKHGKGKWFMKDADRKQLLLRARYDALRAEGGGLAVKKAIEKKSKKQNQKEKKSRPFLLRSEGNDARSDRKVRGGGAENSTRNGGKARKRQKITT